MSAVGSDEHQQRSNLLSQSECKKDRLMDSVPTKDKSKREDVIGNQSNELEIEDDVSESDLQNYAEEIQHLFPKYAVRDRAGVREIQLDNTQEKDQANSPRKNVESKEEQPAKEKKIKKLNFHVIVKNTRLYHALRFVEAYKR